MFPTARPRDETAGASSGLSCSKIVRQPLWIILFFIFLILMAAIQMMSDMSKVQIPTYFPTKTMIESNSKRLLDYCPINDVSGSEGILPFGYSDLTLKHILITIRHGDRSAIHKMPGSSPAQTDKPQKKLHLRPEALQYASDMDSYNLVEILPQVSLSTRITNSTNAAAIENPLKERRMLEDVTTLKLTSLSSSHIFKRGDFELDQGQLTTKGFMQHIALGTFLRRQYLAFLSHQIRSPSNVYVRSTKYDRTFQSAAALLTTLLPLVGTSTSKISILYHPEDGLEVMHGTGLRLSSHTVGKTGEEAFEGGCAKAVALALKEKASFKPSEKNMAALNAIFGDGVNGRAITDLVDSALPSFCHQRQLPCPAQSGSGSGPDGVREQEQEKARISGSAGIADSNTRDPSSTLQACLTPNLLSDIMTDADKSFCRRYTGVDGGSEATKLSTYTFMKEIMEGLESAAALSAESSDAVKLSLYSGHDTVIAPVLAALGLYSDDLCIWPPYASRIVFELWQRVGDSSAASSAAKPAAAVTEHYVRVIYNGKDLTPNIPSCISEREKRAAIVGSHAKNIRLAPAANSQSPSPCSLQALGVQIQAMLGPHSSLEAACL